VNVTGSDLVITSSRNIFITRIMHAARQGRSAGSIIGIATRNRNETARDSPAHTAPGAHRVSGTREKRNVLLGLRVAQHI
jgi:hypothetical protein